MKRAAVLSLCVAGLLVGCGSDEASGVYLILELENSTNVNQYTVFNSEIKSVELCEKFAGAAVEEILASAPPEVPKDSRIKSWRCSLVPPEEGG
ncbi:MAG: hypothetical protein U5J62_06675 [Desulfurivibrio sp.]|nr:hypothetical protein [Desulfurivibrio sp.]